MDLNAMRLRVRRNLGDQAQEFSTADVDSALNRAHRWDVPDALGSGLLTEQEGTLPAVGTINLDAATTRSVQPLLDSGGRPYGLLGDGKVLPITFDAAEFWSRFRRDDDSEGRPQMLLIEGLTMTYRPFPNPPETFYIRIERYDDALTNSGVDYEPRALADVYGAVLELARESGYDFIVAATQPLFDAKVAQIRRARLSESMGKDLRGYL